MLIPFWRGIGLWNIAGTAVAPRDIKVASRRMHRRFLHISRKRQAAALDEGGGLDVYIILREFRSYGRVEHHPAGVRRGSCLRFAGKAPSKNEEGDYGDRAYPLFHRASRARSFNRRSLRPQGDRSKHELFWRPHRDGYPMKKYFPPGGRNCLGTIQRLASINSRLYD